MLQYIGINDLEQELGNLQCKDHITQLIALDDMKT